ncbi:NAD(P)-dependent oxidoreductase [Ligilactobacillus animalis]|uniref:NAD(P)-dependent oxidoreductase n=1 Tax=Ligilactobacillus animalis TaxID=1605 RepID=UPI0008255AB4|nr:NAD(P)-dependent oxidoreductase [Ligilactobacillus animalis]MDO5883447.1 NAD(P)-dependent oxidoreductase [Ligilactobacillus animalis]MDU1487237.1 NAD(P)-dependent oxidoreductase [Ligilactobacillus animalis]MDU3187052.1 NAD(P)-dependent oxidoreductase [Ligilactobacillus animalis]OCX49105.1 NADH-flavin reductase [Ligilactobacillus animalis]QHQ69225.1 NAD(P)H-binding protein [Ligilactobacillus animalis]
MTKVAVISANGRVGSLVVKELVERGYDVTGFGRKAQNTTVAQTYIQKDLFELTKADLAEFEVVVDAFGTFAPETLHLHVEVIKHLTALLAGTKTRLLIVGGAGSLYVDPEHKTQLVDTPDFPAEFYALAKAQTDALTELRKHDDVDWTFISPAADFQVDGKRTGKYILAGEELTLNDRGESIISYADYALAMADEIQNGDHIKERISVVGK